MNKSDVVREVLAELAQDAPAADVAAIVRERYGVNVSAAYVRVCRSRDAREASAHIRTDGIPGFDLPRPARIKPAAITVPAPKPRAPVRPAPGADDVDQGDGQVLRLMDACIRAIELALAGKAQQVTAPSAHIANIASVLDDPEIRQAYPGYTYDVYRNGDDKTLILYNSELPPSDHVTAAGTVYTPSDPRDVTTPERLRRTSKNRERECDFCEGKRPHVLGTDLYQVRGGPIGPRLVILCGMHAQAMAQAGSEVRPYRVTIPAEYGVVRPEPIPYKEMLANATRSFLGWDD